MAQAIKIIFFADDLLKKRRDKYLLIDAGTLLGKDGGECGC